MQALIDPTTKNIQYISSYTITKPYQPIYAVYPNSERVCQVEPEGSTFPIAEPFFWTSCPDNCVADEWYYDSATNTCIQIVNAPYQGTTGVASV